MATLNAIYRISADISNLQQNVERGVGTMQRLEQQAKFIGTAIASSFVISKIVDFGQALLADADALTKLHDKTGMSVLGLQRLQVAGDDAGNTLDEMTSAVSQFQNRLAGDDKSALVALRKLGIGIEAIKAMEPDQQFIAISDAIREIHDPAAQTNVAMDLFGRTGASVLPTLKRGFDDLKTSAVGMSAETIAALDDTGDALTRWSRKSKTALGEFFGNLVLEFESVGAGGFFMRYLFGVHGPEQIVAEVKRIEKGVATFIEATLKAASKTGGPGMPRGLAMIGMPTAVEILELEQASERRLRDLILQAEKQKKLNEAGEKYRALWNDIGVREMELVQITRDARIAREGELRQFYNWLGERDLEMRAQLVGTSQAMLNVLPAFLSGAGAQGAQFQGRGFFDGMIDGLNNVAAAMSIVGERWATVATGIIRQAAVIGTLWQGQRDPNTGLIIPGTQNRRAAVGAALSFAGQVIPTDTRTGSVASGAMQGAAAGAMIGSHPALSASTFGLSIAVGAGVGALIGWYKSEKAAKQVNDVRDAFIGQAGGLEALNQKAHMAGVTLTAVLDAKTPKAYEAAIHDLNKALEFQDQSWERLMDAVDKYGFSIEQLGPALSKQLLDEKAAELITDFRLLEGAGVDVETISLGMSDAINEYVHNVMKAGGTVPLAMKDILQQFVTMGLLTDLNGDKIEDLEKSGITFSKTLDDKFGILIDTIGEMIKAIERFLGITNDAAKAVDGFPDFPNPNAPDLPSGGIDHPNLNFIPTSGGGGVTVNVTVQGNVMAEKDLAVAIERHLDDSLLRNRVRAA